MPYKVYKERGDKEIYIPERRRESLILNNFLEGRALNE
ncbi:hypothetical protein DICTH_1475 [Dictyoglomus thermophilum H-6-12]|uniref:Uncharacterized protein n=1 Tax=Dictyoglomus thermophilum (strain ATCC 35947 / DSM 3960 / H-6-12) TaxID=309799 RepID=B5YFI5_DICT6|nr:hypothetical protein DICTH_1475 [Dictyoglomus thermophilum H-6-12]